jgi:hypothetical protein
VTPRELRTECELDLERDARSAHEVAEMTASSKQSSEHPTFDGISVVPATARSLESDWLVRRGREAPSYRVTSVDVRNTLGDPRTYVSDQGSVVP